MIATARAEVSSPVVSDGIKIHPEIAIVTFSGCSGTGKNYAADTLRQQFPWMPMIKSMTTRTLRPKGDQEYTHLSPKSFQEFSDKKRFLWTMPYSGNLYGTLGRDIDEACRVHKEDPPMTSVMHVHPSKVELLQAYTKKELHRHCVFSFLVVCEDEDLIRERIVRREPNILPSNLGQRMQDFKRHQRHYRESGLYHALIVSTDDKGEEDLRQEVLDCLAQPIPACRRL